MIGPPMSAPARLRSTLRGSVKPELFSRLSMALKLRLLLNSQADPCHLLVPDLVTILNWPPAEWPSSALNIFVTRLKSDTASGITSDVWPAFTKHSCSLARGVGYQQGQVQRAAAQTGTGQVRDSFRTEIV